MKKTAVIVLVITVLFAGLAAWSLGGRNGAAAKPDMSAIGGEAFGGRDAVPQSDGLLELSYTDQMRIWNDVPAGQGEPKTISLADEPANRGAVLSAENSYGYPKATVRWRKDEKLTVRANVDQAGLYQIALDYLVLDDSILPPEGSVAIDGAYPFYEARRLVFPNRWQMPEGERPADRYGNELLRRAEKSRVWQRAYLEDASYYIDTPLLFRLKQGDNEITLTNLRGDLLLGDATIEAPVPIEDYASWRKRAAAAAVAGREEGDRVLLTLEGEDYVWTNDSSIRADSGDEPTLTPYSVKKRLLNMLDGKSFRKGGQTVAWSFEAPKTGYYHLGFKYKQDRLTDMPVFRTIEIDGKAPFREAAAYPFIYDGNWRNDLVSDGRELYAFYLEKGPHTLSLSVNLSPVRQLAEDIKKTMKEISALTLQIQKLTGNRTDAYRDWSITEYMPDLQQRIEALGDRLQHRYDLLGPLNPAAEDIGALADLKLAIKQLAGLAKEPDEVPNRLGQLSQGSSSVSQLLGNLLEGISESPLSIDKIYWFQGDGTLIPKAHAGGIRALTDSVKRFWLTFGEQQYASRGSSGGQLNVWVNRPRQYVEMLQSMIDERFTPETGIEVKLSIMPDENKLILANASGNQPDVALGVSNWLPYDMAIRGALKDLRTFGDYGEVIRQFSKGAVIPLAYEEGVYALPETQNFWVLFYRKDLLDSLKLSVPDTWNDIVGMLPELQRLGMNFYDPLASFRGFKPFPATTPFIYQFGGELYRDDGMTTAIDSEQSLEGIKFMTDLFTIYNVPQDVPNFYNHFRYGTLPVGISDFQTYILLKSAAPEIAGQWKIALHPGVDREGKIERWSPAGGQTGVIFEKSKRQEDGWRFLKWWMSADVQTDYANRMQTIYGDSYMWNTANLRAFEQLPWPEEDKKVILAQAEWVREASRVPGAYMIEREISNVWNKVVFDGTNPRTAIDDAVIRTNREIARKMEEFGYAKDGRPLKPYPVPTLSAIDKWVERE